MSDLFDIFIRVSVAELFLSLEGDRANLSVDLILEALHLLLHKGGGMLRFLYGQLDSSVVALELTVDHDFELLDLLGLFA